MHELRERGLALSCATKPVARFFRRGSVPLASSFQFGGALFGGSKTCGRNTRQDAI